MLRIKMMGIFVAIIWLWTGFGGVESLPHLQKAFKCAGDNGLICETGLCYDSLGFYEGGQNVGCAQPEMCTQVGCFMYKNVFTCCCANRFCNGKTEMLMLAKYEMFKENRGSWPTHLPPRIFARNISVPSEEKDRQQQSDVRLAPQRKSTSPPQKPQQSKSASIQTSTQSSQTSSQSSTTTKIATLPLNQPKTPKPLVVEKEVKLTSSRPLKNKEGLTIDEYYANRDKSVPLRSYEQGYLDAKEYEKEYEEMKRKLEEEEAKEKARKEEEEKLRGENGTSENDVQGKWNDENVQDAPNPINVPKSENERTTRSSQEGKIQATTRSSQEGKIQATTSRPRKPKERKEKPKEEPLKVKKEEVHHPKYYPWYAITLVGFIIASIFGVFVYLFIKKYRNRRATKRDESLRNASSVDSSRVSSNIDANEKGSETLDPLLSGEGR